MQYVDYKEFNEDNFTLVTKEGEIIPFLYNDTQSLVYSLLEQDYPDFNGIRENWLKARQWGGSTMVAGMFMTDFILAELGEMPLNQSEIYSHKDKETYVHFARCSHFLDSWLIKNYQTNDPEDIAKLRKAFLRSDELGKKMEGNKGCILSTDTANAKTSGRGGTKQNILFTEIAFYPNTEIMNAKKLVSGADKQVKPGTGKIFRESSGNLTGDYWQTEYDNGKLPGSRYKSRFFGWWLHKEYALDPPSDWVPPKYYHQIIAEHGITRAQCYWHHVATRNPKNHNEFDLEELREYPTYDTEAFLLGGDPYFEKEAIMFYQGLIKKPMIIGADLREIYGRI